jgi:hypothetical protein
MPGCLETTSSNGELVKSKKDTIYMLRTGVGRKFNITLIPFGYISGINYSKYEVPNRYNINVLLVLIGWQGFKSVSTIASKASYFI